VFARPEVVLLFVIFAIVVGVALTLSVAWPWKLVVIVVGTPAATMLCSLISPQLGRLARFLLLVPQPQMLAANVTFKASVMMTVTRAGANADDPNACRVVTEYLDGTLHVEEVLPPNADVVKAMKDTIPRVTIPVLSVRAMRGSVEVAR
jgi:hypothetical protein